MTVDVVDNAVVNVVASISGEPAEVIERQVSDTIPIIDGLVKEIQEHCCLSSSSLEALSQSSRNFIIALAVRLLLLPFSGAGHVRYPFG
jgi:hypothetical protein